MTEHSNNAKPLKVRSVEPLIEELTGPMTLTAFGFLLRWLPEFSFGPISRTNRIGTIAAVAGIAGIVALVLRWVRASAPKDRESGYSGGGGSMIDLTAASGMASRLNLKRPSKVAASADAPTSPPPPPPPAAIDA